MLVELSYKLDENMPVYPGSPTNRFEPETRMDRGDLNNTTTIVHFLHNGSHVDAPYHFYNQGAAIDEIPIDRFIFEKPLLVNVPLPKSGLIGRDALEACGEALRSADLLIFHTGYCRHRQDAAIYTDDFPALSEEAARFIRTELLQVKAVAIDTLSIESAVSGEPEGFKVHKTLLDGDWFDTRPVLVFEDIDTARALDLRIKKIYAFPLRLKGLDGSPVTMVAECE